MKFKKTIHALRKDGWKVKVDHYRFAKDPTVNNFIPIREYFLKKKGVCLSDKGGQTNIILTSPKGKVSEGKAICVKQDNFNRRLGSKIALGRALKKFYMTNDNPNNYLPK